METTQATGLSGSVLFYTAPEPLNREQHAKLGLVHKDKPYGFAATGSAVPLTVTEFTMAAANFPIIFAGDDKVALAVMGLNTNENLFINADGSIELGTYIPAYVRRYPFVLANDDTDQRLIVCIDRGTDLLVEGGQTALFDDKGEPTEYTQNCIKFCDDFEVERRRTESFVKLLKDNDRFELKTAMFTPVDEAGQPTEPQKVAEYFGVSEEKLNALPAEKIKELQSSGALGQIYAHLVSLVGWDRLIGRAMARQPEVAVSLN